MPVNNAKKIILLAILTFLQISMAAGTRGNLERGNQAYQQGKFQEAFGWYLKAARSGENASMARFNMANSLYQLKQVGRALVIYEALIQENPTFVRPYINAAGIYFSMDEIGNALQLYGRALEIEPDNATAIKMTGECWLKLNNRARAIESFERGLRMEPTNTAWHFAIVDVYLGLGDHASARLVLQRALRDAGESAQILYYLAEMDVAMNDHSTAVNNLQRALDLDPTRSEGWTRLAQVQETRKEYHLAAFALKEGLRLGHLNKSVMVEIARLLVEAGDPSQAQQFYEKAASNGENGARSGLLQLAWKYRELGHGRRAVEVLLSAISLFPGDSEVQELLIDFRS